MARTNGTVTRAAATYPAPGTAEGAEWLLTGLAPSPTDEWDRLAEFIGIGPEDDRAMAATVEALLRHAPDLVVGTYDYLRNHPPTAAILGWEEGPETTHLAERRAFFAVWLARLLGLDRSHDLALYLFKAGVIHAGHGPRQVHVPEIYVSGAVSLVQAAFARYLGAEMPASPVVPAALAGWNKTLTLHAHMMHLGYQAALALSDGDLPVTVAFYGRLRSITDRVGLHLALPAEATTALVLRRVFNYFPRARAAVFDVAWQDHYRLDARGTPWLGLEPAYRPRAGWRVLVNGREIGYLDGLHTRLHAEDRVDLFPPGR